jgi:uncharacterized protein with PhoU and TrkA domain
MEQQLVRSDSPLAGKTVGASGFHSRRGLILIAIKHSDGKLAFDPDDEARILPGDTLITLGLRQQHGREDALALSL